MPDRRLIALWIALVTAVLPLSLAFAQTAETTADADEARTVVLDAIHALLTDSYHYASSTQIITTTVDRSDRRSVIATVTAAEGIVGPGGDNDITITSANGKTIEGARYGLKLQMERIVVDGVTYVHVNTDLRRKGLMLAVNVGWYRLDDLLSKLPSLAFQEGIQAMADIALPSRLAVPDAMVMSVQEVDGDTVDGAPSRVFDMKIDALALVMQQAAGTPLEKLEKLYENRQLYSAGTFVYNARVWIDAATGRAVKLHVDSQIALPYVLIARQFGLAGLPDYDVDTTLSSDVTLTHWGEPVEIEAPTLAAD